MKRIIRATFVITLISLFANLNISAKSTKTYIPAPQQTRYVTLTSGNVNLRWGPSMTSSIYSWSSGSHVHFSKGTKFQYAGSTRNGFHSIHCDGHVLWVSTQWAKLSGNGNNTSSRGKYSSVVLNGTNVNFRTAPSMSAPILTNSYGSHIHVPKYTRLPYLGSTGNWYKANYNGTTVYISKQFSYLE